VGWDWFSLALDDGRDLMIYLLRRADGGVDHRSATLVRADGKPRYLAPEDWSVRATATWKSPFAVRSIPRAGSSRSRASGCAWRSSQ